MAQITANGDYGPFRLKNGGGGILATQGTFDGATVQMQYSMDLGVTKTNFPGMSQTAAGVLPFNMQSNIQLYVNVSGGDLTNSMDFFLSVRESDGANNLGNVQILGAAQESTLAAQAADVAELKELSFGTNGVKAIVPTDSGVITLGFTSFHGIQVVTAMPVTSIAGSNVGTDLDGETLPIGYHPVTGTGITVAAGGFAYLVEDQP